MVRVFTRVRKRLRFTPVRFYAYCTVPSRKQHLFRENEEVVIIRRRDFDRVGEALRALEVLEASKTLMLQTYFGWDRTKISDAGTEAYLRAKRILENLMSETGFLFETSTPQEA